MVEKEQFEMDEDPLVAAFRKEIRVIMERVLREELNATLEAEPYVRSDERSETSFGRLPARYGGTRSGDLAWFQ